MKKMFNAITRNAAIYCAALAPEAAIQNPELFRTSVTSLREL